VVGPGGWEARSAEEPSRYGQAEPGATPYGSAAPPYLLPPAVCLPLPERGVLTALLTQARVALY
jgi:hypothetical protein